MEILVLKGVDLKGEIIYNLHVRRELKMENIKETVADYSWQKKNLIESKQSQIGKIMISYLSKLAQDPVKPEQRL